MSSGKMPMITNLWSKVVDGEKGEWFSKVVIESTKPYQYAVKDIDTGIVLAGSGVLVNMPEGRIEVNDGLIREINITQEGAGDTRVEMVLEHPVKFDLKCLAGFPHRLVVNLDRSDIIGLFKGKKIVVDPGHGGRDFGGKGPVSLLEKNVVVPVAKNLEKLLHRTGAQVLMTRGGDEDMPVKDRISLAVEAGADAYISLHTHASADSSIDGAATLYATSNSQSARLAGFVQEEIIKKLKVRDRGTAGQPGLAGIGENIPAVEVEVVTITNIVEEVFLRGLTIQKRAAEGIVNGLIKYFALEGRNLKGDVR
ncbi:MAG: N-acetylmuramoyl-L-alanine amidase [Desulfotomaculaceae bacterium]